MRCSGRGTARRSLAPDLSVGRTLKETGVTARKRDAFPIFLREHLRPVLRERGYGFAGQTATLTRGPATAHLCFMRYTSSVSGKFDVRMSVILDA